MSGNVSDIKPWFREDHARTLMSIYTPLTLTVKSADVRFGMALVFSALALAFGVNPESFMKAEDIQLLRSNALNERIFK